MNGHNKKENLNRLSEEFVYDSNCQKHIGKRTGNLYRRVNFKQHFDGFPRFSDYQSHHQIEESSLAQSKKKDPANLDDVRQKNLSQQKWREQLIDNKKLNEEEENKQSRGKQGFDLEEFKSTIMKKNSSVQLKTSERKDYKNLLKEMHNNEEQSFVFKEQRFQNVGQILIGSETKWQKEKQIKNRIRITFYENTSNQDRNTNPKQLYKEKQKKQNEKEWKKENSHQVNQQDQLQMKNRKIRKQKDEKKKQRRKRSQQKEQIREIKCSSKYCILTQQKQIIKQLYPLERQIKQCQRYPKRMRMKPVQFWENEKVHYREGQAIKIERSTLNMKSLICTKETYPNKININISTQNIEIQVKIPGKKQLRSSGIPDIYQKLQISLTQKLDHQLIHYQDAIKKLPFVYGETITVDRLTQFLVSNWSKKPVTLLMILVVKND